MSTITTTLNTGQQAIFDTDLQKIFLWGNRYGKFAYAKTNSTYDDFTLPAGTLMGRKHADGYVIPLASGASDGSQYPVGILAADVVVLAGESFDGEIQLCVAGDVNEDLVLLDGSDTLDTVISARTIRDRVAADTVGIILKTVDELTKADNS